MLSANYIFLRGGMDVNTPGVTNGQLQSLTELNTEWQPLKSEYDHLQKQVEDYNTLCKNSGIEKITIPEKDKNFRRNNSKIIKFFTGVLLQVFYLS